MKEILTFIFDGYADWESAHVCSQINKEADYVVKTISFDKEPKVSMGGFRVIPDYSIDDYPKEFEALLLIGGDAWMERKNDKVKDLVDYAVEHNIPVGAICGATFFIGENGYVNNKKHTSNDLGFLKQVCPNYKGEKNYINEKAVYDENVITASGIGEIEFAREVMKCLKVKPDEKIDAWYNFQKNGIFEISYFDE